jgi:prepilin-type N-terminal cleavage/methylation domain-containing protein
VTSRRRERGFTLLEVVVAATILTLVVSFVYQLLTNTVKGQDMIRTGLRAPKIQNAILQQILRDLRYVYWVDFAGSTGFLGQNRDVGPGDGDRLDFVTARRTRLVRADDDGSRDPGESPVNEVGYACQVNEQRGDWIGLYRREDFFVDDDPVSGGTYSLIYDRLRSFNLMYFPNPRELGGSGKSDQGSPGLEEWDSRLKNQIPYAIVVEIKFDIDEPKKGEDPESITRLFLLRAGYEDAIPFAAPTPGGMTN